MILNHIKTQGLDITDLDYAATHANPFYPEIGYHLAESAHVRLSIFDLRGRELAVLVDGHRAAGDHVEAWEARTEDGTVLSSGVYLVGFRADGYNETRKITLMK